MMKKTKFLVLFAVLTLLLTACGPTSPADPESSADTVLPGGPVGEAEGNPADDPNGENKSDLYDPSIFIIEASGSWRQELAPGHYADYECELYLDKFDANDNRSASGLYTGVFWIKTSVEAEAYLNELLQNVPVEMEFEAGGEGVCDNLTMHLLDGYTRDSFGSYAIPDGKGGEQTPAKDALAGEGGFIAVGMQAYLKARASGAAGETLEYQDAQSADAEIRYVIQVEPDPTNTATERKVTIYLSNDQGMSVTLDGVWRRLPGYPEDRLEYANSGKSSEVLKKHLP